MWEVRMTRVITAVITAWGAMTAGVRIIMTIMMRAMMGVKIVRKARTAMIIQKMREVTAARKRKRNMIMMTVLIAMMKKIIYISPLRAKSKTE